MLIRRISLLTGTEHIREVPITGQQAEDLTSDRGLVQEICPELPAKDREFLITGITRQEWENAFGGPLEYHDNDEIAGVQ